LFRRERGAGKAQTHKDFVDWLHQHRHDELVNLILTNPAMQDGIDKLVTANEEMRGQLDRMEKTLLVIAKQTKSLEAVALAFSQGEVKGGYETFGTPVYEARKVVYDAVRELLQCVLSKADVTGKDRQAFLKGIADRECIFGEEVVKYTEELWKNAVEVGTQNKLLAVACPSDGNREKPMKDHEELLKWFCGQAEVAQKTFGPYLRQ
jgi:hypothetical protein